MTVVGNGFDQSASGQVIVATELAPSTTVTAYKFTPVPVVQPASQIPATFPVATFKDFTTTDTASDFTASINWGDGDTSQGLISPGALVTGVKNPYRLFTISGDYAYANPGTYTLAISLANNASGQAGTGSTTATIVNTAAGASNPYTFSIALAAIPSNGPNNASGLAITNRPTFSGTAAPYAIVQLTANRIDVDAPLSLGQAIANGSGQWYLAANPLADGIYDVTATVTPPGGAPQLLTNPAPNNLDQFVIDTTAPRVVAVKPLGTSDQVLVSLRAGISGMNLASMLNPASYTFSGSRGVQIHPSAVRALPTGNSSTVPQSVVLTISSKPKLRRLIHTLSINGALITDKAGIPLQGGALSEYSLTTTPAPGVKVAARRK